MAESILARVPAGLDALTERMVVGAASRLGFRVEEVRGRRTYAVEFGNEALVDSLPGVTAGTSFIGTFDREHAVEDDTIDFFSSGHALVEGLLLHFDEDPRGRVARLELRVPGQAGSRPGGDLQGGARVRGGRRGHAGASASGRGLPRFAPDRSGHRG